MTWRNWAWNGEYKWLLLVMNLPIVEALALHGCTLSADDGISEPEE